MRQPPKICLTLVAFIVLAAAKVPAQAAIEQVLTRAALAGSDFLDWGDLGASGTLVPQPFVIASDDGVNVTVSKSQSGSFQRVDQPALWAGDFAPGEELLWTVNSNTTSNVMRLSFGGPGITGGGAQIQAGFYGPFTVRIEAFDSGLASLGFYDVNGTSGFTSNGSAIFLGIRDTTTPIYAIEFSLLSAASDILANFAINQFDFSPAADTGGAVPEGSSVAIWCVLAGVGAVVGLKARTRFA